MVIPRRRQRWERAQRGLVNARGKRKTVTIHIVDFPVKYLLRLRKHAPYVGENATAGRILQWAALSFLHELETRQGKAA